MGPVASFMMRPMTEKNGILSEGVGKSLNAKETDRNQGTVPYLPSGTPISSLVFLYLALTVVFTTPWVLLLLHAQSLDIGRGRLLINECLSAELALIARERGHHEASHVVWIGKSGWKDWDLKQVLLDED